MTLVAHISNLNAALWISNKTVHNYTQKTRWLPFIHGVQKQDFRNRYYIALEEKGTEERCRGVRGWCVRATFHFVWENMFPLRSSSSRLLHMTSVCHCGENYVFRKDCCQTLTHTLLMYDNGFFLIPPHFHVWTEFTSASSNENTKGAPSLPLHNMHAALDCAFHWHFDSWNHLLIIQVSNRHKKWISRKKDSFICLD